MEDKQIMAGLLLDKDKAAVPEALEIVTQRTRELHQLRRERHHLARILTAIIKNSGGTFLLDRKTVDAIRDQDVIEQTYDEKTGCIAFTVK